MEIAEYRASIDFPLRRVTLCFPVLGDEIVLARKLRGFGAGLLNGMGGKPSEGDINILDTAKREVYEEIGVYPGRLHRVGTLNFFFPEVPTSKEFNQEVCIYLTHSLKGSPIETEEMSPTVLPLNAIPYDEMWPADRYWLPFILAGKRIRGNIMFVQDSIEPGKQIVKEYEIFEGKTVLDKKTF